MFFLYLGADDNVVAGEVQLLEGQTKDAFTLTMSIYLGIIKTALEIKGKLVLARRDAKGHGFLLY